MTKVGIFGGTFNPIHNGHLNSIKTVKKELDLDKVLVVPAFRNPHRPMIEGPDAQARFELVKIATDSIPYVEVSRLEIQRKGLSYTVDTIKEILEAGKDLSLYLIIGADQFAQFSTWNSFDQIISLVNLVVTSRPGEELPESAMQMPPELTKFVETFHANKCLLKTGKSIYFVKLDDIEVSASEVRSKIMRGESVSFLIPEAVENTILERNLYRPINDKVEDFKLLSHFAAQVLHDKKGFDLILKDFSEQQKPMEYTLICSSLSRKHASALADQLVEKIKQNFDVYPQHMEGQGEGKWVVLDYGSLIVHIFYDFARQEYQLEEVWRDAETLELNLE